MKDLIQEGESYAQAGDRVAVECGRLPGETAAVAFSFGYTSALLREDRNVLNSRISRLHVLASLRTNMEEGYDVGVSRIERDNAEWLARFQ